MTCEYDYCIYNKKLTCILDEIQVNSSGMCDSCETVAIPQESLEEYKEKRLLKGNRKNMGETSNHSFGKLTKIREQRNNINLTNKQ